jgi:hypothetical protein
MEVSDEVHVPAALPSTKDPPVTIEYEADGDTEKVWKFWRRGRFISLTENLIPCCAVVCILIYT